MSEEVNVLDVSTVKNQELPSVLTSQFDKLVILETNVQKAVNMAVEAKNKAENAQVKIGLFDFSKKEAINLLQSASEGLAEGLMTAAEAQKVSFEYQTKLTEISKFLFGLGVSNLAMNRSVVRELELKLKGASEEEISDLARQELKNVIIQLKAQEDMMKKQDELTGKVKKHQGQLESINRQLNNIEKFDEQQDSIIVSHSEKLLKHDKAFEEQQKKNAKLEQETNHNADTTKQLKDELSNLTAATNKDSETIKENISSLLESVNTQISLVKEDLSKVEVDLSDEINFVEEKLINTIAELKEEISNKDKEVYNKLTDLKNRIDSLDVITSKLGWKIGISIVAAGSLILNILQICGIF